MTYKEIDEMIHTVDKNGDGKINYSEFRVMMGAHPLIYLYIYHNIIYHNIIYLGDDGGAPTHHPRSPGLQVWTPHLPFTTTHHYQMRSIFNEIHFLIVSFINICRELTLFVKIYQGQLHYQF